MARQHHIFSSIIALAEKLAPLGILKEFAASLSLDIEACELIEADSEQAAAAAGVALCRSGQAEALMKGRLHTDHLMHAIMQNDIGLRTLRRVSHVFVLDVPAYPRMLLVTDAAINIYPDLEAGNMLAKELECLAESEAAGIVLGAQVPIILTSRADSAKSRMASCAVAVLLAHAQRSEQGNGRRLDQECDAPVYTDFLPHALLRISGHG